MAHCLVLYDYMTVKQIWNIGLKSTQKQEKHKVWAKCFSFNIWQVIQLECQLHKEEPSNQSTKCDIVHVTENTETNHRAVKRERFKSRDQKAAASCRSVTLAASGECWHKKVLLNLSSVHSKADPDWSEARRQSRRLRSNKAMLCTKCHCVPIWLGLISPLKTRSFPAPVRSKL